MTQSRLRHGCRTLSIIWSSTFMLALSSSEFTFLPFSRFFGVYAAWIRFRFEFLVLRLNLLLSLFERCTHVYFVHTHECRDWVHLDSSGPPSWGASSQPLGHIEYHMCSVCHCDGVCARIHTHTHTYTPTRVKNRENTRQYLYLSFCQKQPFTPSDKCPGLAEPPHPQPPTWMNKLRIYERMCTPCSNCVADMNVISLA